MTREEREEAIAVLKAIIPKDSRGNGKVLNRLAIIKAILTAIEALEPQPCEDYINRKAVLDGLASIAKAKAKSDAQKALMGRAIFFTEQLPSVAPPIASHPSAEQIIKGTIKQYLDKPYIDTVELLLDLNHDLCERIKKAN